MKTQTQYTVVIKLPDYCTDGQCATWVGHVEAADVTEAIARAQHQCAIDNDSPNIEDDLLPISVFAGYHMDLIGQWALIR